MSKFTYTGDQSRVYPHIFVTGAVLVAEAGKTYDLEFQPSDGRWEAVTTTKAPKTAPQADSEPETTEVTLTINEEQ
jgi:hypothetical protein